MKIRIALFSLFLCLLITASTVRAILPPWDGNGVYSFAEGEIITEAGLYDNATLNMTGGTISSQLICFDNSILNMSDGYIMNLSSRNYSILNLSGGDIYRLNISGSGTVNFFVDNYTLNPDTYLGYDQLTGTWYNNGGSFDILLVEGIMPSINFIPEPSSILLFGFGATIIRTFRKAKTS